MNGLKLFHTVTFTAGLILLGASAVFSAWQGLVAVVLGLTGTAVYLWGTWIIVRLAGTSAAGGQVTRGQSIIMAVGLLLKLPLIYAGWLISGRLGPMGPTWFLLGLALVYCAVVWRAVLASREKSTPVDGN